MLLVEKVRIQMSQVGTKGQLGFTLLELIVVVALGTFLSAILPPKINALMDAVKYQNSVRDIIRTLQRSKIQSILHARREYILVDSKLRKMYVNGSVVFDLPPSHDWDVTAIAESDQKYPSLYFDADGSSSGGVIVINGSGRSNVIEIDWFTGQIVNRKSK